jgi:hypothetical protein
MVGRQLYDRDGACIDAPAASSPYAIGDDGGGAGDDGEEVLGLSFVSAAPASRCVRQLLVASISAALVDCGCCTHACEFVNNLTVKERILHRRP